MECDGRHLLVGEHVEGAITCQDDRVSRCSFELVDFGHGGHLLLHRGQLAVVLQHEVAERAGDSEIVVDARRRVAGRFRHESARPDDALLLRRRVRLVVDGPEEGPRGLAAEEASRVAQVREENPVCGPLGPHQRGDAGAAAVVAVEVLLQAQLPVDLQEGALAGAPPRLGRRPLQLRPQLLAEPVPDSPRNGGAAVAVADREERRGRRLGEPVATHDLHVLVARAGAAGRAEPRLDPAARARAPSVGLAEQAGRAGHEEERRRVRSPHPLQPLHEGQVGTGRLARAGLALQRRRGVCADYELQADAPRRGQAARGQRHALVQLPPVVLERHVPGLEAERRAELPEQLLDQGGPGAERHVFARRPLLLGHGHVHLDPRRRPDQPELVPSEGHGPGQKIGS
mmetsp:Transcript_93392/g.264389  ORF Transcript_93392/g.264389 Transcript_93392/m.264389 type:complete len:400 (+) Transcript_93392:277-1476(+)